MNEMQFQGARSRRILIAVEPELCDHALLAGLDLARRLGAEVELVHAVASPALAWQLVEDSRPIVPQEKYSSPAIERMLEHFRGVVRDAGEPAQALETMLHVGSGRPAAVILERAREISADLIVLGALRGRRGLGIGSTSRAVLGKAPCPVWVQPSRMTSIRRILAPVDLSETSLRALAAARDLASRWNAAVRALNCFDTSAALAQATWIGDGIGTVIEELDQATAREFAEAMELFDWRRVTHEILHLEGDPVATIVEQASSCDLIVMGTHGIKNVAAELLGSVVYSVIKRSTRPVLAVHAGDRSIAGFDDRADAAAAPKLVKSN